MTYPMHAVKYNDDNYIYINGDVDTDGSRRFGIDGDTGFAEIQKKTSGVWEPASFEVGANSLYIGKNVHLLGIGHHVASMASNGHGHLLAHSEFDGETNVVDTTVANAYSYEARRIYQADNSGTWTGTELSFSYPVTLHVLIDKIYYQTSSTAATEPVRIQIYEGTDDTGNNVFDQTYPASLFAADSEIQADYHGYVEYDAGTTYFTKYSSAANFSFKTDAAGAVPWIAADVSDVREDNLLQTKPWVSGESWAAGDYFIDSRKIYICNTTGAQSGTFASNSALWDEMGQEAQDLWTSDGSTLQNTAGPTALAFNTGGIDVFGFGKTQSYIWADNSENYLAIAAATLIFKDGTRNRIEINDGLGYFKLTGKDGSQTYTITDTEHTLSGATNITGTTAIAGNTTITSPSGNKLTISDTALTINDGTRDRIATYGLDTRLTGYDGLQYISVDADNINLVSSTSYLNVDPTTTYFYDGTRQRFNFDSTSSRLISPDGNQITTLSNSGFYANDGVKDRLTIDSGYTTIKSPTGAGGASDYAEWSLADSGVLIMTGGYDRLLINDSFFKYTEPGASGKVRILVDSTDTSLISPSEAIKIEVDNTNVTVTGDLVATGDISNGTDTGSYIIANRIAQDYTGGAMVLKGAENGSSVNYSDFNLDNFFGWMRIYCGGVGHRYLRINNADPTEPVASNLMHMAIDGGIITGDATAAKTASVGIEIKSTTEALLLSRMTTTQRNALTALNGMAIYNTTTNAFNFYENGAWVSGSGLA